MTSKTTGIGNSANHTFYSYDGYNRLSGLMSESYSALYLYNLEGLRKSKTVNGEKSEFSYLDGNIACENTATNSYTYYRGSELLGYVDSANNQYFYNQNTHGDVISIRDATGKILKDYTYSPYGETQQSTEIADMIYHWQPTIENVHNSFEYCGEYIDSESGFIYLRNRYYDPSVGRFITEDPIRDGVNWYGYCGGNPINFIDPNGKDAIIVTARDAAVNQGHTSLILQDKRNGTWNYFYWGDKAIYFITVPWVSGDMDSLNNFVWWIKNQNLPYNTTDYTSATYVEGDFHDSIDYIKQLVADTVIESGWEFSAQNYDKPTLNYYQINTSYDLLKSNCLQKSMEAFYKGKLNDGTKLGTFMNGQLSDWESMHPNSAEKVFYRLFFNRRFTPTEAKNDVEWEANYGTPPKKYKHKGLEYAETLGVYN